ncbi:3859_t:CDS:10, partial [Entrophospora sp. SA101]
MTSGITHIDRERLYTDLQYRFNYVAQFVEFGEEDIKAIKNSAPIIAPLVDKVVELVYEKLFSFDITKQVFLARNEGFTGKVDNTLESLQANSEQIKFRKDFLKKYLVKLVTAEYDERFVNYLNYVGKIHTSFPGKASRINVEYIHCNALFSYVNTILIDAISKAGLENDVATKTTIAFTKLLWIQNDLFARHYVVDVDHNRVRKIYVPILTPEAIEEIKECTSKYSKFVCLSLQSAGTRAKIENGCSDTIMLAYTEVIRHLERLDLASIRPEAPLASGVIDLSGNLGPDFDPVFMGPIAFPHGEMTVETRRILMTVFDLLEGLPLLTEDEYSENAYVIHAVSKLDMVESELVLAEVSRLLPQQNDTTDTARSLNIELGKVPVLGIQICELVIPLRISSRQIVEEFLKNALKLRSVVEKIIAMAVGVKDEINLLPVIEDRTPSSSMMSTTYSPPRNITAIQKKLGINSNINQTAVSESKKAKKLVDSYELLLELVGDLILIQGNL